MNIEASSSSRGGPHPKRSNPPLPSASGPSSLRVPTSIRRCPCVTPSRETFVTVVSLIVAVPLRAGSSVGTTGLRHRSHRACTHLPLLGHNPAAERGGGGGLWGPSRGGGARGR